MNAREAELVTEEFCKEDNYNLCPGGHGGFGYINQNKIYDLEARRLNGLRAMQLLHATGESHSLLSVVRRAATYKKNCHKPSTPFESGKNNPRVRSIIDEKWGKV